MAKFAPARTEAIVPAAVFRCTITGLLRKHSAGWKLARRFEVCSMAPMIDRLLDELVSLQNPDGGWGAVAGKSSNTEATALAVTALQSAGDRSAPDRAMRGVLWLVQHQNPDGGLRLNDATSSGSWTTALAVIALGAFAEQQTAALNAARWLLRQEGSKPGILAEIILFLTGKRRANELNRDLVGWSWVPNSFSWVEPTSYALIALKKVRPLLSDSVAERIRAGEALVYDRMCKGGGWNYGNSRVLDYALWPYPDITAIALIALQDRSAEPANQQSLSALRKTAVETNSGLACAWTAVCLSVYGQETGEWLERIDKRFAETKFLGETKTTALALLAHGGKTNLLRI
jgi:hypothetical protein